MENQAQNQAKLFAKIAKITGELGAIGKDAKHYHGYKYVSADNLRGIMRHKFEDHQLTIIPSVVSTSIDDGWINTVYAFTLCCGETGATFTGQFPMSAPMEDAKGKTDDKVSGKAMTYAMKYWMLALFQVSDQNADDLDKDYEEKRQPPNKNNGNRQSSFDNEQLPVIGDGKVAQAPDASKITVIESNGKTFYKLSGATMWERKPLSELGFNVDSFDTAGDHQLPEPVEIWYRQKGKHQNIAVIVRTSTGMVYDVEKNEMRLREAKAS